MILCQFCGCDIKFRAFHGRIIPIHERENCSLDSKNGYPDECRKTHCPKCGRTVYFVKHNGGVVWFDELGNPWEKHPCFLDEQAVAIMVSVQGLTVYKVRDVKPLLKQNGYAVYYGKNHQRSEVIDVIVEDAIPSHEKSMMSKSDRLRIKGKWIYLDKTNLYTLDGRSFAYAPHLYIIEGKSTYLKRRLLKR